MGSTKMKDMYKDVENLLISFSGGRTSGYMTHRILQSLPDHVNAKVVFANTGQEDNRTLDFVHDCEEVFGWDIHWVEAVVIHNERVGTKHKLVDYTSASRKGEPFEDVIKKYGIPNQGMPHCTRELKLQPIKSFCKSLGWAKKDYHSAVGIRADEIDRMSSYAEEEQLLYPLIKWDVRKPDVLEWWRKQNFDLNLPEHRGNCTWCWKKSFKKLVQVHREDPNIFEFPKRMEEEYASVGAMAKKTGKDQLFFRGYRSTEDIIEMSKSGHVGYEDPNYTEECAESCEVFSDTSLRKDYGG